MCGEETGLFAPPPRDHDTHQAQELMQEGNVEAGFDARRRRPRSRVIPLAGLHTRRQEQPAVRIEGRRLGGEDGHPDRRVLVWNVYCPTPILASETAIPAQQATSRLVLDLPPPIQAVAAIAARDDGQTERDRCQQSTEARAERSPLRRCGPAACKTRIGLVAKVGETLAGRPPKGGLSSHQRPTTAGALQGGRIAVDMLAVRSQGVMVSYVVHRRVSLTDATHDANSQCRSSVTCAGALTCEAELLRLFPAPGFPITSPDTLAGTDRHRHVDTVQVTVADCSAGHGWNSHCWPLCFAGGSRPSGVHAAHVRLSRRPRTRLLG